MTISGSSAKTAFYFKKNLGLYPNWKFQYKIKCQSTENELSEWLRFHELKRNQPFAVIAREQSSGFGQYLRPWLSPRGGIWLSAAYPIFSKKFSVEIFGLSLAIKICEMLREENIKVDLKWPNDILFESRKLIGLLPKVITRGKEIIYVRAGVGMNLLNKTPPEGISLAKILKRRNICEYYWTAKILKAFIDAIECNDSKEYVVEKANKLVNKSYLPSGYHSEEWVIQDVNSNGNLRIYNKFKRGISKTI